MSNRKFSMIPDPSSYKKIGDTETNPYSNVGELVSNSLDWAIDKGKRMIAEIDIENKKIIDLESGKQEQTLSVIDRSCGMDAASLENALVLGSESNERKKRKKITNEKGFFGFGLKNAAAGLGVSYEIYTRPIDSENEHYCSVDLNEMSKHEHVLTLKEKSSIYENEITTI